MKLIFLLMLFSTVAMPAHEQNFSIADLSFMSGCWKSPDGASYEQWMKPEAHSMLGMSRTISGGKTVFHEFLHIAESEGKITLTVVLHLGGKVEKFFLVRNDASGAVFENPEIDFPQRIMYKKISSDELYARIEGTQNGKEKFAEFPMKRTSCE